MLNLFLIIASLIVIFLLLTGGKIKPLRILKFFSAVFAAAAILILINTLSGFALTGLFGILLGLSFLTVIAHYFSAALFREIAKRKKGSIGAKRQKGAKSRAA